MAKSKPAKPAASSSVPADAGRPDAAHLRSQLAATDAEIIQLVQERAKLSVELARQTEPPAARKRGAGEDDRIEKLLDRGNGLLPERCLRAVFRELRSGCRSLVQEHRIAILGPMYSFSHLAALHRFGQSVEYVPVGTIAAVFEEVHCGHSAFGLVPIENSTDGRVADSLDMFTRLPVKICGLVEMHIHHTLLGNCARGDVREVYSKPQALSQCRNWLAKHLPAARTVEVTSTSTAAQLAREKPDAAAIASRQAGVHFELDVLAENIEDNPGNLTRFAVIGGESPPRTGNDHTAMLFQVEHRPGTLAEAMNIFKRNQVNLTWIDSFPIPGSDRVYLFFVEMEGHQMDARIRKAVKSLGKKALRLEILGSFPMTKPVD